MKMVKAGKLFGITALALILLSAGACASATPSTGAPPAVGKAAPDFMLRTLDGQPVSLSSFKGKPVLVNFWATWCGPCRSEMPYLQQINDRWSPKGLVLLAVDIGEQTTTVRSFMTELKLSMTVPMDADRKVSDAWGITAIPTSFLIDKDGIVRQKVVGAFPSVAAIEAELGKIMP